MKTEAESATRPQATSFCLMPSMPKCTITYRGLRIQNQPSANHSRPPNAATDRPRQADESLHAIGTHLRPLLFLEPCSASEAQNRLAGEPVKCLARALRMVAY